MWLNKLKKSSYLRILDAFLASTIFTLAAIFGVFADIDNKFSDFLYQSLNEKNPDIIVIGIDPFTINRLGLPITWSRSNWAKAIKTLNDGQNNPAVIGIDMLFSGPNNHDPAGDELWADTIKNADNIVLATMVAKDENQTNDDNSLYFPWNLSLKRISPYEPIASVASMGSVNAPDENVARHALLYVNIDSKDKTYSFDRVIYNKWCEKKGITPHSLNSFDGDILYYIPFSAENYRCGYNFLDLLDKKIPPEVYKDKIVLIGPYAPVMADNHATALDYENQMYGIDIHANCIQAFQNGFIPYDANEKYQLLGLFVVCFICEFLFLRGNLNRNVAIWLIICFVYLSMAYIFYRNAVVLHALWIPLSATVLFIGSIATNYMRAKTEREIIYKFFGKYVDPMVMKELLLQGTDALELGGKPCDIAVLFVDIRGFTTMSEKLSAESVVEILNRYLTLVTDSVYKHRGTLDKFIGDAVMAFWNAPTKQDDAVLSACQAALDMLAGSTRLCAAVKAKFGVDISFGIGIHWGSAVVGNIGTNKRMDYTAIGDTVNTAARLESNAQGGQILISRAVADALDGCGETEPIGRKIILKGKEKGFEILVLKSLNGRR